MKLSQHRWAMHYCCSREHISYGGVSILQNINIFTASGVRLKNSTGMYFVRVNNNNLGASQNGVTFEGY